MSFRFLGPIVSGRGHNDPVVQFGHIVNPNGGQDNVGIHRDGLVVTAMGYGGYKFVQREVNSFGLHQI